MARETWSSEITGTRRRAEPGTYKYIKIALLGSQQKSSNTLVNAKWADATSSAPTQEYAGLQAEWGAPFATPLSIAAGDSVVATLTYDLSGIVFRDSDAQEKLVGQGKNQPGRADDCAGTATTRTCIEFPELAATAAKVP